MLNKHHLGSFNIEVVGMLTCHPGSRGFRFASNSASQVNPSLIGYQEEALESKGDMHGISHITC